jgi:hypothetical protein
MPRLLRGIFRKRRELLLDLLATDGGFSEDGAFHPLGSWDADAVMKLFRERRLARLVERHAISEDLGRKLVAWTHPGFSSHRRSGAAAEAPLLVHLGPAHPLVCRRCGGPLRVVAYITDALAIRQILEHLDLSPPEKPPPEIRDVVRVPVDDEGREIDLQPA